MFHKIRLFRYLIHRFEILELVQRKATARNPYSMVVKEKGKKKFVVIAASHIQKFYLKRSIFMQEQFRKEYKDYFEIILPDEVVTISGYLCVIYPFVEGLKMCRDGKITVGMEDLYKKNAIVVKPSEKIIQKILSDMLRAWPPKFHNRFMEEECLMQYLDFLRKQSCLKIYKEHGDFNCENVLKKDGKYYLFDFEFAKLYQPIGQDTTEFDISIGRSFGEGDSIGNMKIQLCNTFNHIVDGRKLYRYRTYLENHILFPLAAKVMEMKGGSR